MSDGFRVDPDELVWFAGRLAESADELAHAASALEAPVGDLGPQGVTDAVTGLLAEWAGTLRSVDLDAVADSVRAAGQTYLRADELP